MTRRFLINRESPGQDFGQIGIALSVCMHIVMLAFAAFGLPRLTAPPPEPPDVVEVEFVEVAEETATKEQAPPQPEPETQEPEQPAPEPEPEPQPEKMANVAPEETEPAPSEAAPKVPMPDDKPEPETKPEPEPEQTVSSLAERVTVRRKPEPPSRFDVDQIAALIDKSVDEPTRLNVQDVEKELEQKASERQASADLRARRNQARIEQMIRQKVQRCWSIPVGVKDIEEMSVKIRLKLRPDGSMLGPPKYVNAGDLNAPGREYFRTFAESARRAVQRCAPYDLPVDLYDSWDDIVFNFDAGAMVGG